MWVRGRVLAVMPAKPGSSANFTSETTALYRENRNLMDDWPKFTYSAVNGQVNSNNSALQIPGVIGYCGKYAQKWTRTSIDVVKPTGVYMQAQEVSMQIG
jgi:hypothetical protein